MNKNKNWFFGKINEIDKFSNQPSEEEKQKNHETIYKLPMPEVKGGGYADL